ncbi:hypothetical protein BGZ65_009139, partial [Modicella reniformis]
KEDIHGLKHCPRIFPEGSCIYIGNVGEYDSVFTVFRDVENVEDHEIVPYVPTPKRAPRKRVSASPIPDASRTPSEFKRKGKNSTIILPVRREPVEEEEEEEEEADEPHEDEYDNDARDYVDDDRMRFSDEEPKVYELEEDDEEMEEEEVRENPLLDSKWLDYPELPMKRTTRTKEMTKIGNRRKRTTASSPPLSSTGAGLRASTAKKKIATTSAQTTKAMSKAPKKVSRGRVGSKAKDKVNDEDKAADKDTEDDDDHNSRRVPSRKPSTKKTLKNTESESESGMSRKAPAAAAKAERTKKYQTGREIPVELVEVPIVPDTTTNEETGVRRSHRVRFTPLSFWKNERVVMGRDEKTGPVIKAILRAETPPPQILKRRSSATTAGRSNGKSGAKSNIRTSQKQKQRQARPRSTSHAQDDGGEEMTDDNAEQNEEEEEEEEAEAITRKSGKAEVPNKNAEIVDYETRKPVSKVIAESKDSIKFQEVEGSQYQYHRGLEDTALVSGSITILPGEVKPATTGNGSAM